MKKGKPQSKLSTIVRWIILVTLIAALVEIPVVYFYASSKGAKNAATVQASRAVVKPEPTITSSIENKTITVVNDSANMAAPRKQENFSEVKTALPPIAKEVGAPAIKTDTIPKAKLPAVKKIDSSKATRTQLATNTQLTATQKVVIVPVHLSEEKMTEIANAVVAEQARQQLSSKCIKVQKAAGSNASNAFAIADQLKKRGFIISGREDISKAQKGYSITTKGACLVLTIGTL